MSLEDIREVRFLRDGQSLGNGVFTIYDEADSIRFVLELGSESWSSSAEDCFEAFCEIRRVLELRQIFPSCAGAMKNVFPSGMSRDMGSGIMAYRLMLGCPAKIQDLIDIFAQMDGGPVTVAEQHQFFEEWLESLGA